VTVRIITIELPATAERPDDDLRLRHLERVVKALGGSVKEEREEKENG